MKRNKYKNIYYHSQLFPYLREMLNEYRYYEVYKVDSIVYKIIDIIMPFDDYAQDNHTRVTDYK